MALVNAHCGACGTLGMFANLEGSFEAGWTRLPAGRKDGWQWLCEYCTAEGRGAAKSGLMTDRERDAMSQEAYDLETLARFAELRTRLFLEGKIADQEHPVICAGETVVAMAQQGMTPEAAVWWLQTMPARPESWEAM